MGEFLAVPKKKLENLATVGLFSCLTSTSWD